MKELNDMNIEQLKIKTSQIDSYIKTINSKDELIQKLKNDYIQNEEEKIETFRNEIKALEEKNKNLMEENQELKKSKMVLIQSTDPEFLKGNQSINIFPTNYDINKSTQLNVIKEEPEKKIKKEKEIEIKANKVLSQSANSADLEEEEFDVNYLANTAKKKNNSEDMKIDFPGLSDINEKYEDLKNKIKEIKEIFNLIISKIQINEPDIKSEINKVLDLLEITQE